jgi:cobalt-zinc-cadmium efflux system protein
MNLRSAYLHLFSDSAASLAVIIGGLCIFFWGITWIDPLIGLCIVIFVLKEGYKILISSINILMQCTPQWLDLKSIQQEVLKVNGISDIHHVHVWQVNEEDIHLEAHINLNNDIPISESCSLINNIESTLLKKFRINHVTLQLEYGSCEDTSLVRK